MNAAQLNRLIYLRKLSELRRLVDAHKPLTKGNAK